MKKNFNEISKQENKYSIHNCKSKLIQYIRNFIILKSADLTDINSLINVIIGDSEYNKTYYKYFKRCAILLNIISMGLFLFTSIYFLRIDKILWFFCMVGVVIFDIRLYICKKEKDSFFITILNLLKLIYLLFIGGAFFYYTFIFGINMINGYKNHIMENLLDLLGLLGGLWFIYALLWLIEYIYMYIKHKKELHIKSYKVSNKISVFLYIVNFVFLFFTLILSLSPYIMESKINNEQFTIGICSSILIIYSLIIIKKNHCFLKNSSFKLTNIGNVFISILPIILQFISDILEKQMK